MPKVNNPTGGRWFNLWPMVCALSIIASDQLSKLAVRLNLIVGESAPETGFLRVHHIQNTGAAFGLFRDQTTLLIIIGLIGAALIIYALFFTQLPFLESTESRLAVSLVLGGTIGNLIDRITMGLVTDFIGIGPWPEFNIADSAVVIGTSLFAYTVLRQALSGKDRDRQQV